jgi:hypothetical protein
MLLIAALLLAQFGGVVRENAAAQAPPTPAYAPEDLCLVEGQVVNALTGDPVRKAFVYLSPEGPTRSLFSAFSDASGHFSIRGVSPGRYRLQFSRSGFVSASYNRESGARGYTPLILDKGQKLGDILVRAAPLGVVSGRVLDENGDPVSRVNVQLARLQYMQGRKQLVPGLGATTNDLGEYRAFDVPPGRYYVVATYMRELAMEMRDFTSESLASGGGGVQTLRIRGFTEQDQEEYAPTFYPGTTDAAAAVPLDVGPGAQLQNINLRLARTRMVRVKGRVSPPGASVMLMPRDRLTLNSASKGAQVDRLGNFEIAGVMPGAYILMATVYQGKQPFWTNRLLDVGAANIEDMSLSVPPPVDISGQVRVEGDRPDALANLRVALAPYGDALQSGPMPNARLNGDRSFKLEAVSLGRYRLSVSGLPDGYYVKAIRSGGADALTAGLDISSGALALDVVLSPNAGQITGVVEDEKLQKAAAGATVALVPQEPDKRGQSAFYRSVRSDDSGRFTFRTVPPGEYKVFAFEEVEGSAYMDPEFLAPLESKGAAVTVKEGDRANVQAKLIQ